MDNDSIAALKYDSRLARRRGWVDEKELAQQLASLPDVADKIAAPSELEEPTPGAAKPTAAGSGDA